MDEGHHGLAAVVERAMAKDPADRFPDARSLGAALTALADPEADAPGAPGRAGLGGAATDAVDLSGRLTMAALVGVLERAALFVGNDSGPRHLAEAVGTPTVGVFTRANLVDVAPLFRARHRVLVENPAQLYDFPRT